MNEEPLVSSPATLIQRAVSLFESPRMPDAVTRAAIHLLVARTSRSLARAHPAQTAEFARQMMELPIALHADAANAQHYEVPAEFFALVLGPQRKYSSCLYTSKAVTLAEAEEAALAETAAHADIRDGQSILELGCGWGSLTLWIARRYPSSRIVAVSNSHSQKAAIERRARDLGLGNVRVVTADANVFEAETRFDRIVSIEMFEHMANWDRLLRRVRGWLNPDGLLLLHVFTHATTPYRFDHDDPSDWIAKHFFTGGLMPSETLIDEFSAVFARENSWRWSGEHYRRTANDWLANCDRHADEILDLFRTCYGQDAELWLRRWRLFFLATAGLFGFAGGREWGVSHYLLRPVPASGQAPVQRNTVGMSA
jgi:cyclopropane-fatty-acyl-phospholipid synthase